MSDVSSDTVTYAMSTDVSLSQSNNNHNHNHTNNNTFVECYSAIASEALA